MADGFAKKRGLMDRNNGKEFERLVKIIYSKLDSESKIKINDKIEGQDSKIKREIDLSIRRKIGAHEVLIIVQARDYNKRLDINDVGEFLSVIKDVRANKGVIISAKGFSKSAIEFAKTNSIDTLTAHDFVNPKWTLDVKMPVILTEYSGAYKVSFDMVADDNYVEFAKKGVQVTLPSSIGDFNFTSDGKTFFTAREAFYDLCMWDNLIYDNNEHSIEHVAKVKMHVIDDVLVPVKDLKFQFKLTKKSYYKYFDIKEFIGLIDNVNHKIKPTNFRIEGSDLAVNNYNVEFIDKLSLKSWNNYNDSIKLIHPYNIRLAKLTIAEPKGIPKFEFKGNDSEFLKDYDND
jgi:hypothetical protein